MKELSTVLLVMVVLMFAHLVAYIVGEVTGVGEIGASVWKIGVQVLSFFSAGYFGTVLVKSSIKSLKSN